MRTKIATLVFAALLPAVFIVASAHAQTQCPPDPGAALAAACPCAGKADPQGNVTAWKNHGQFVSCIVRFRNDLRRRGCLNAQTQRTIASCAARSTCGKANAVLCCKVTSAGPCNGDPMPGDGTKGGTCSNQATVACDTDADCTVLRGPVVSRDAAMCTAHGGYSSGPGSVCAGCAPPVACCLSTGCQVLSAADCSAQMGTPSGSVPSCASVTCP
jgi:hypothetical protein